MLLRTLQSERAGIANSSFNLDRWKGLFELGVLNSNLPQDKGGLGMDQVTLALMVEEMGYAGST